MDLPAEPVRADILRIHSNRRGLSLPEPEIGRLAAVCEGFSGAEIEQAIVSAVYAAHAEAEKIGAAHVLKEIKATRPLSVVMAERIEELREWARDRTVPAD